MLLTETIIIKWRGKTRKHYEEKGYVFTKMGDAFEVRVEDLTNGDNRFVNVKCDCEDCKNPYLKPMRWADYIRKVHKDGKYYCHNCAMRFLVKEKALKTVLKKGKSFEQWCIENNRQDVLDRWDYELNGCKPSEVTHTSCGKDRKGYWFKCPRRIHKGELRMISAFTKGQEGSIRCNQCNSFAQWGIDNLGEDFLDKYWDYDKNTVDPWDISYASKIKVFIYCQKKDYHGSYDVSCDGFSLHRRRCRYCYGRKTHPLDSLGQYIIDNFGENFLKSIWSDRNEKTAFEYMPTSGKKVWWTCENNKHNDYLRNVAGSNSYDFRCPDCSRERKESFLQEKVRLYLELLGYEVLNENNCNIMLKNPRTQKGHMDYDNEIEELKLIIEVHGMQHYRITSWTKSVAKRNKTTPEYELHMQKVRDRYKRMYAKSKGYNYLEIPYWTDNSKEEWKRLIDNKIKEIMRLIA